MRKEREVLAKHIVDWSRTADHYSRLFRRGLITEYEAAKEEARTAFEMTLYEHYFQYKVRATFEAGKSPKDFGSREWAEEVVERLAGHNILAYVVYSEYPVCLPMRPASYEHFDWSID